MSIRLRLTLLYSTILALTLILFSVVLYILQAQYTLNIVKKDLAISAQRIVIGLARMRHDRTQASPGPGAPWPEDPQAPPPSDLASLRGRDSMRFLTADGAPQDLSTDSWTEDLPLSKEGLAQLQSGQPWVEIASGEEGRWLVRSDPVVKDGEIVAIVQVGRALADRDRSLRALGLALISGSLLTTIVAFGVGWALAGITLRPIHRITQTALEIGQTRDFSSRVEHKGPNDELSQLATTFNGMLARLQGAYQQVAHSLQVQRDFVTDVSHELRTPLTTIRGNLALLDREPPLPCAEQEDILADLAGENERLIRLVGDLLTLARADAGRKLHCEKVNVRPLVDDVCRQARLLDPGREIACEATEDAVAIADPDALKQVLLILLDNAVRHAQDPIRVVLGASDQQIAIHVQDSGPGMPPELCERAFDRFYRGDESRSTSGFGLGLSIAKALIEAQQGTLTLESTVGEGSTFTMRLPRETQEAG